MPIPPDLLAAHPGIPPALLAKDWKAAQGFAAMATAELLEPIFDTVDLSKTRFGGGAGEAAWKPILVQAIGQGIAAQGGLGLTATVFRELLRQQQDATAQQPDGGQPHSQGDSK